MYCVKCDKHISQCNCPDIEERLQAIRASPHVVLQICKVCDKPSDICKCPDGPTSQLEAGHSVLIVSKEYKCPVEGCSFVCTEDGEIYRSMLGCMHDDPLVPTD